MKTAKYLALTGTVLLLCAVLAQAKPDFTGEWKMNAAKSDFGQMPPPSSYVQKITHKDPELKIAATMAGEMGEISNNYNCTTDGKECSNTIFNSEMKSALKWDGDTLVIQSKADFQGNEVTITEKWALSEDGKTLTVNSHFSSQQGEGDMKVVLEKQEK